MNEWQKWHKQPDTTSASFFFLSLKNVCHSTTNPCAGIPPSICSSPISHHFLPLICVCVPLRHFCAIHSPMVAIQCHCLIIVVIQFAAFPFPSSIFLPFCSFAILAISMHSIICGGIGISPFPRRFEFPHFFFQISCRKWWLSQKWTSNWHFPTNDSIFVDLAQTNLIGRRQCAK